MKTLLWCGVLISLTGIAQAQEPEGAGLPDSAILARSGGARATVPGEIPDIIGISSANNLTQGDMRLVIPYVEWVLQTPLSTPEKNEMRRRIIADWSRPDSDLPKIITARSPWAFIKGAATFDRAQLSDSAKSDDLRRLRVQKTIITRLRAQAGDDADAQWILARYAAARRPLTAGAPLLTQPIADMMAGATVFALNEVAGQKIAADSPSFRAALTRRLVSQWPKMTPAQRREITSIPERWPAFKSFYWPNASASGRE